MAKKNTIRLTESELKKIISESVKKVLKESGDMDRSALYQRVKNVYNNGEGSFYDLMDEFGMSEDELYKTGIADMWGNLDAIEGYERQEKMFAHQYENKKSKLKKIVSESVKKVLRESIYDVNDDFTSSMTSNIGGNKTQQIPTFKHVDELDPRNRQEVIKQIKKVLYNKDGMLTCNEKVLYNLGQVFKMTDDELENAGIYDIVRNLIEIELEAGNVY